VGGARVGNTLKCAAGRSRAMAVDPDQLRLASFVMAFAYAVMVAKGFVPSWRAQRESRKPVRTRREVPHLIEVVWVSVQGVVMLGLLGGLSVPWLVAMSPLSLLRWSEPYTLVVATLLFLAGAAYAGIAARHLGEQLTVSIAVREGGRLVTSGPYARVRHPIYTGIFLMVGGLALAFASPILAAWVVVAIFCASVRARAEEAMFVEDPVLGESYRDYLGHTGRFLPTGRKAQGTGKSPGDPGHP